MLVVNLAMLLPGVFLEFHTLSIATLPYEGPQQFVFMPLIDGAPLNELVVRFETAQGWRSSVNSYGGLAPRLHYYGSVEEHFLGLSSASNGPEDRTALLICPCGVPTCWPFLAKITATQRNVVWSAFEQPHRRERDYSAFGPFTFRRAAYVRTLRALKNHPGDTNP